ncbi:hypothetical protein EJB05_10815, partial [Eragrostis curvula]
MVCGALDVDQATYEKMKNKWLCHLAVFSYGDHPDDDSKTNLGASLNIFYGMVLGQGILYIAACILEMFSCIPKRSFSRHGELRGQWGVEFVNLYYAYAFERSMEGDVLAPKKISLNSFAIYCVNSDMPKMQLHGIRVMHSVLQREETGKQLLSKLATSTKKMARLIEMLDWSSPEDTMIRLFAAKVTAELATSLRVITIPGTIQVVSTLLDYGDQQKTGNPLLDTDVDHEKIHDPILNIDDNREERLDAVQDTGNLLETQEHSTQQAGTPEQQKSWILRCWQRISGFRSIPQDEPLTERDLLPALGMSILDGLIGCDQDNCVEISRASGLIPKIIRFTSYGGRTDTIYTNTQRKVLTTSSLKLLHSLTSIPGEIGITLRHKISKNPFLLRNLADVLGDSMSSKELRKLVTGILRNLAIDRDARQAIGRVQVIISRLMHAFLTSVGASSTESDRLLRKVAGQALAVLAMDSTNNCLAMLREPEYEFIKELTCMIHVDKYRWVAASLLQNMCLHARCELKEPDLKELSYSLREVLERIMNAEGAELEIVIGLSSQICLVIPVDFARELEHGQIMERYVKRLVDALNANWEPSADCPGIRRVILEQAINLMEYDSRYANFFNGCRMMEALSTVEETASEVENYRLFLGDAGLMEAREPLPRLVARTKQLLAVH